VGLTGGFVVSPLSFPVPSVFLELQIQRRALSVIDLSLGVQSVPSPSAACFARLPKNQSLLQRIRLPISSGSHYFGHKRDRPMYAWSEHPDFL